MTQSVSDIHMSCDYDATFRNYCIALEEFFNLVLFIHCTVEGSKLATSLFGEVEVEVEVCIIIVPLESTFCHKMLKIVDACQSREKSISNRFFFYEHN